MKTLALLLIFCAAGITPASADPVEQVVVPVILGPGGSDGYRDVARCGGPVAVSGHKPGVAPVMASCSARGTRTTFVTQMVIGAQLGYTGTVAATVRGETFGGMFTVSCEFILWGVWPYIPATCSGATGAIGFETIRLDGAADGVGLWEVAYQQRLN